MRTCPPPGPGACSFDARRHIYVLYMIIGPPIAERSEMRELHGAALSLINHCLLDPFLELLRDAATRQGQFLQHVECAVGDGVQHCRLCNQEPQSRFKRERMRGRASLLAHVRHMLWRGRARCSPSRPRAMCSVCQTYTLRSDVRSDWTG